MEKGLAGQPVFTKTESEVKHNVKVSYYPDGRDKMTISTKKIFLEKGYELSEWKEKESKPKNMENETRDDSVRRAKQRVFDISRLNRFKWFVTWTLDAKEIDRYDKAEVSKKLKRYLQDRVKRNAAVYMIIPEYHKDGAIHMHGLLAGNFKMIDSGVKTKGGQTIYNMPDWKLGYSTAIELDDNVGAISRYITKYISKDFKKIFGSFYYAGGRGLMREPPIALYDIDYSEVKAEKEYIKFGIGYKYVELGNCTDEEKADLMERIVDYYDTTNA